MVRYLNILNISHLFYIHVILYSINYLHSYPVLKFMNDLIQRIFISMHYVNYDEIMLINGFEEYYDENEGSKNI
jgi:hypothetical protein